VQNCAGEILNPDKPVSIRPGGLAQTQRRRDYFNNLPSRLCENFFSNQMQTFTFEPLI
jgi:hypothetical protein